MCFFYWVSTLTEYFCLCDFRYATREPALTSTTFHCESGVNKLFSQPSHVFHPNLYPDDDLYYNAERDVFPVAIHCVVEDVVAGESKIFFFFLRITYIYILYV